MISQEFATDVQGYAIERGIPVYNFFIRKNHWEISHKRQDLWAYLSVEKKWSKRRIAIEFEFDRATVRHGIKRSQKRDEK